MFNVVLCIATEHNWGLVGLAALVCAIATLATFFLYSRVPPSPVWRRWLWLGMTGLVAGSGIWTTHFVAMLAFKTGMPTGYAILGTLGSLAVAVISTTLGFEISSASRRPLNILAGGLVVGLGITAMHYVGMGGYRTAGWLQWNVGYVAASVAIGAIFSIAALWTARNGAGWRRLISASGLMTLAICGMHFTGMTAVTIVPDASIAEPATLMSTGVMVTLAVAVTALIVITAIGGVALDAASRNVNLRRLREALDVMPEGLAFYDAADRLVAWNTQYADLCRPCGVTPVVGLPFSDLLQASIVHGVYPDAAGREAEWIAERKAARWGSIPSLTQRTAGGRWLRITERRTADGGTVSVSVDITDLKTAETAMAQARDAAVEQARRAEFAEDVARLGRWRLDLATFEITGSAQLRRIFGLPADAPMTLESVMARTHPDDVGLRAARLREQIETGVVIENSVTRIIRPDGEVRLLAGDSGVERDTDGKIIAVAGILVDVTEQKDAEDAMAQARDAAVEQARRAELAEDVAQLGHWRVDLPSMGVTWSAQMYRIYGLPLGSPLNLKLVQDMTHPEDAKLGAARLKRQMNTGAARVNSITRIIRTDGELRYISGNSVCERNAAGEIVAVIGTLIDITEQRALEDQLRQAREAAEKSAAVKSEFLANMSHELRTPLTSILGFTDLASKQAELSPLTRNYIERVGDASRALLSTVNDVLDFSKLEAGQVSIHPQPFDLAKLGHVSLGLFAPQAGAKDISLTMTGDLAGIVVLLDQDRIRQILLNLVGNAVKFTALGGVTLHRQYDRATQTLRVDVTDTGPGIPKANLDSLFKRFSQIDGALTRGGGTGLGLAICKGLVEAMGGEIGVESRLGEGSRFWFSIPAPLAEQTTAAARTPSGQPTVSGVRVLVADDHPANRELARLFLEGAGAEITEAANGTEAVQLAAELPFDVILMDMRMPRLDGPAAMHEIRRASGPNDATPILAFTAEADADAHGELTAMGFQGVVLKPVTPGALIAAVARATAFASDIPHEAARAR